MSNRTSWLEKCLIIALLLSIIIAIILFLLLIPYIGPQPQGSIEKTLIDEIGNVCLTAGCIEASGEILNTLKPSVKPCDDFYKFACGSLDDPAMDKTIDFMTSAKKVTQNLKMLIEKKFEKNGHEYIIPNLLYKKCSAEVNATTMRLIQYYGNSIFWAFENVENLSIGNDIIKHVAETGFSTDALLSVFLSYVDPKRPAIFIGSGTPQIYEAVSNEDWIELHNFLFNQSIEADDVPKIAVNVENGLRFRDKLKTIINIEKDAECKKATSKTIKELQMSYPSLNWRDYLEAVLPHGTAINENVEIYSRHFGYFEKLEDILNKTHAAEPRHYIYFRLVEESLEYLPHNLMRTSMHIMKVQSQRKIKDKCREQQLTSFELRPLLANMYARKYNVTEKIEDVLSMAKEIQKGFYRLIDKSPWLDSTIKKGFIEKVKAMNLYAGYVKEIMNETFLQDIYESTGKVYSLRYMLGKMYLRKSVRDFMFRTLQKPLTASYMTVLFAINTFEIDATFGLCHAYFTVIDLGFVTSGGMAFYRGAPNYVNYGGTGWIIAQKMMQMFSSKGILLDHRGVEKNAWSVILGKYNEKRECIKNHYNNITDPVTGVQLNGTETLDEHLADIGGLEVAYEAYQQSLPLNDRTDPPRLPALKYNANQLFWIQAARLHCSIEYGKDREATKDSIAKDKKSLPRYRAIGSLQNNQQFARDFKCQANDVMNPKAKCIFWAK